MRLLDTQSRQFFAPFTSWEWNMAVGNAAEKYPKDPNSSFWSNKRLQGMFYLLEFGLCSWLDLQMRQWF